MVQRRSVRPFKLYGRKWTETRLARAHLHTELIVKSGHRAVWVETKKPKVKPDLPLGGGCCSDLPSLSVVAGGTKIAMPDGSTKPIEQITNMDRVRTGSGATARVTLTLQQYMSGSDLLHIQTEGGDELDAQHNALIVTPDGPVDASDLRPGDQVVSEDGPDQIAALAPEYYAGVLAGIAVDTGQTPPTIFANGIAVATR